MLLDNERNHYLLDRVKVLILENLTNLILELDNSHEISRSRRYVRDILALKRRMIKNRPIRAPVSIPNNAIQRRMTGLDKE